jgi:hypothetical protein
MTNETIDALGQTNKPADGKSVFNAGLGDELLDLLTAFIDAYEDGADCYEGDDEITSNNSYIGKAVRLDEKQFNRACDILNEFRPVNYPNV